MSTLFYIGVLFLFTKISEVNTLYIYIEVRVPLITVLIQMLMTNRSLNSIGRPLQYVLVVAPLQIRGHPQ